MSTTSIYLKRSFLQAVGSGKSYVVARTSKMFGMRVVNSDDVFEKLVKSTGMNMDMRNYTKEKRKKEEMNLEILQRE